MSRNSIIDKLKHISIFKEIKDNHNALKVVSNMLKIIKLKKGTAVFKEGDLGEDLFIVNTGKLEVLKKTGCGEEYTVTTLSAEMNIFVGEISLMDPEKRSATVTCLTDCEFFVFSRRDFYQLGNEHPKIGLAITRAISKILCGHLRKSNADVITLFEALVGEVVASGGLSLNKD